MYCNWDFISCASYQPFHGLCFYNKCMLLKIALEVGSNGAILPGARENANSAFMDVAKTLGYNLYRKPMEAVGYRYRYRC